MPCSGSSNRSRTGLPRSPSAARVRSNRPLALMLRTVPGVASAPGCSTLTETGSSVRTRVALRITLPWMISGKLRCT